MDWVRWAEMKLADKDRGLELLRDENAKLRAGYVQEYQDAARAELDLRSKLEAENAKLRAAGKELCDAIDQVICWYSSGFAPQSQSKAYKRAQAAKVAFNIIDEIQKDDAKV